MAGASLGASRPATDDELVKQGRAWLSMDAQARRLMTRWAGLESTAMGTIADWCQLTDEERSSTSFGAEMNRIDRDLATLFGKRDAQFAEIEHLQAHGPYGVITKLAVASRLLHIGDNEAASLVRDALSTMKALYPRAVRTNVPT